MAAGYGRSGWSSGKYGQPTDINVTGVVGTGAVGSVAVSTDHAIAVTGVAGTGAVGSVTATGGANVTVTGVAGTGAVGSVTVSTGVSVSATGVAGTGAVGSVTATGGATVTVTGVAGTGSVGDVTTKLDFTVSVTGVSATGEVAPVLIWGLVDDAQSITWSNVVSTFTVTVAAKTGGGNAFYINGVEAPTLTLVKSGTYRFDTSNSTTATHPFRFSTTSDGTHGGGSIYSDGVTIVGTQGESGSYIEITVASDAPTLHYFCTSHSGMGGQINIGYSTVDDSQSITWEDIAA
tara:strand:+ start:447 stop:1319 length:873 start_codon:yes stop_codon:yes gene_type:complete